MSVSSPATAVAPDRPEPPLRTPGRSRVGQWAVVVLAPAAAVLVGAEGSPGWRLARVVAVLLAGAGALTVERRGGRPAGVVALLLGVVAVCAGAGIGVMHLVKSDVTPVSAAALVVLAAGLVLLGLGTARLWRATPGWWRLLALPIAFVLLQFVFLPVTTAVYATNLPATRVGTATPSGRGLTFEDVTVTARDGVHLAAWYVPSTNGAAVVLLHGSGSNRTAVLPQAAVLARHGYGVLLLDARGHGDSDGVGMDFGWWGDRDVSAAVDWLQRRPDVVGGRIGAVGMSMGGEEALGAAGTDPRIRAVVTEGALWRGSMDTGWLAHDLPGWIDRGVLAVQTQVTRVLTAAPEPVALRRAVAATAPRPVLLVAGQDELAGDRWLRAASPATVQLWELPDTPHIAGLARHPAEWETRVTGFLDTALGAAGADQ